MSLTHAESAAIRAAVARVGDRIQPLLHPHPGLVRRNAYAHLWLGIKVRFGDDWRETAEPRSVLGLIEWIGLNPNEDYDRWGGPVVRRSIADRGLLFE